MRHPPSTLEEHNRRVRWYFERTVKPTMVPRRSRYLRRHIAEALRFANISHEDHILEIGCGMGRYTLVPADLKYTKRVFKAMERAGLPHPRLSRFGLLPPFLVDRDLGTSLESRLERIGLWQGALLCQLFGAQRP